MPAYRNVRLCGKDCICLYVCPTGATNTENSVIDVDKCIECMACVDACISSAIAMIPRSYPPQQPKAVEVISAQHELAKSKLAQEGIAAALATTAGGSQARRFFEALERSNRSLAEDLFRESGYMIPQSKETRELLESFSQIDSPDFPREACKLLLDSL